MHTVSSCSDRGQCSNMCLPEGRMCVCVCVTSMSLLQRAQEGYATSIQHLSTALLVLVFTSASPIA